MGSSSRKKSTSKKRSSKLSSKARSMKKSKKTRSRKRGHRHRHDSSSDDDSVSSLSISSPSGSYSDGSMSPRPKRRSVKKREKHASKTSSSRKDNRDSKKRKKSKKNDDAKPRKKLKRDAKISSDSKSERSEDSESERSEDERVKKRSREQKKGKRDRQREKSVSPLSTSRSVSPSSVGYQDEIQAIGHSEETFVVDKKSRRLKSVIVIPERSTEEDEPEKDVHFEEIVNDRDDYPYKSSSGEGGREGSTPSPPDASAYGQHVENDGFTSDNNGMSELTTKRIEVERVNETKELEAILKQKALENLEKFRVARKTRVKPAADQKDVNSGDHNGSVRTEIDKNKLAESKVSDRDIPSVETAETPSLNNQPEEANEDTPKFQEKPISKMSGGEMVQTKYQIYIPKRAPRKFNR